MRGCRSELTMQREGSSAPIFRMIVAALLVAMVSACAHSPDGSIVSEGIDPVRPLGEFSDDYDIHHTVTADEWFQHPNARYRIVRWNAEGQYLIAQNAATNVTDGGLWTRIDWMPLTGMSPYEWAFCLSAYNAISAEAAERVEIARRDTPKTGCGGYPFSRMRRGKGG
jgi:hypothetical protein